MSSAKIVRQSLRLALAGILAATVAVTTAPPASATASLTVAEYGALDGYPYGVLTVSGTAMCSTSSGSATISISASQVLRNLAFGWGTTTVSCASQPAYWWVTLGPEYSSLCYGFPRPDYCFVTDSIASVDGSLNRNGVEEATTFSIIRT